jgi:hypothetical protein
MFGLEEEIWTEEPVGFGFGSVFAWRHDTARLGSYGLIRNPTNLIGSYGLIRNPTNLIGPKRRMLRGLQGNSCAPVRRATAKAAVRCTQSNKRRTKMVPPPVKECQSFL